MRLRTATSATLLGLACLLSASAPLSAATGSSPNPTPSGGQLPRPQPDDSRGAAAQTGCTSKVAGACGGQTDQPKKPTPPPRQPTATPRPKPPTATPTPTQKEPTDRPASKPELPDFPPFPGLGQLGNGNDNRPARPKPEPPPDQPDDQPTEPTATPVPPPTPTQPTMALADEPLPLLAPPAPEPAPLEPLDEPTPTPTATPTATATPTEPVVALAPPPTPLPTEVVVAPLISAAGLRVSVVIEPPDALASLVSIDPAELRGLLGTTLGSAAPDLPGLAPIGDELSWSTSQGISAGAHLAWPRRLELRDGIYLDLVRSSLDDPAVGPAASGPRQVLLVLTPAYRLEVLSAQGEVFGSGIYRHGSVVSVGLRDAVAQPLTTFGLLGGVYRLLGWEGLDFDGSTLELTLTGPGVLRARWQEDSRVPAALGTVVALLTLLFRPVLFDWSQINLLRKLPWLDG